MTAPIANPGIALAEELCRQQQDAAVTPRSRPWTRWRMPRARASSRTISVLGFSVVYLNNRFHSVGS